MRILVVEDQTELREAIVRRLQAHGFAVDPAADGRGAQELKEAFRYDVVVLDRMLPDGDGAELMHGWRRAGDATPVLLLTAMDRVVDRVDGLERGADDYLVKPFAMEELLARVAALTRRGGSSHASVLRRGDLELDLGRREVRRQGVLLPLRSKEWALLELLVTRPGQVVTRSEILDSCWDMAHEPGSNVEEVTIASLRRKLGTPRCIHTVRGMGYRFEMADG